MKLLRSGFQYFTYFKNAVLFIYSLLSPSGSRLEAPNSTSHRLHTLCRAWLLLREFSHNRLQNDRQATISRPVLWLTLDALRFHAERRDDASGCTWLQEADPEGHGLWSATTSRRLPGPGFGAAHDGGPPGRPRARPPRSGLSVPSEKWGERLHARPRRPRAAERPCQGNVGTATARSNPATQSVLPGRWNPLPPRPGRPAARIARSPYHTTRRDSSKNPGKTRSSLAMAQRRPKSTIPGMAEAPLPGLGPARRAPLATRSPAPSGIQPQTDCDSAQARARVGPGARALSPAKQLDPPRLRRGADPEGAGRRASCFARVRRQF